MVVGSNPVCTLFLEGDHISDEKLSEGMLKVVGAINQLETLCTADNEVHVVPVFGASHGMGMGMGMRMGI